jgi:hypothetical protein
VFSATQVSKRTLRRVATRTVRRAGLRQISSCYEECEKHALLTPRCPQHSGILHCEALSKSSGSRVGDSRIVENAGEALAEVEGERAGVPRDAGASGLSWVDMASVYAVSMIYV